MKKMNLNLIQEMCLRIEKHLKIILKMGNLKNHGGFFS